jgi:hypothetical protein
MPAAAARRPASHRRFAGAGASKKNGRLPECGTGRIDHDRDTVQLFMDRTLIGGYTGYVVMAPSGVKPPKPEGLKGPGEAGGGGEEDRGLNRESVLAILGTRRSSPPYPFVVVRPIIRWTIRRWLCIARAERLAVAIPIPSLSRILRWVVPFATS